MIEISAEKFKRLIKGEKVYFSRQPLQHGKNIFTHQLVKLAQGETVPPYSYFKHTARLSDDVKVSDFLEDLIKSPLNEVFALMHIWVVTHPKKEVILSALEETLRGHDYQVVCPQCRTAESVNASGPSYSCESCDVHWSFFDPNEND